MLLHQGAPFHISGLGKFIHAVSSCPEEKGSQLKLRGTINWYLPLLHAGMRKAGGRNHPGWQVECVGWWRRDVRRSSGNMWLHNAPSRQQLKLPKGWGARYKSRCLWRRKYRNLLSCESPQTARQLPLIVQEWASSHVTILLLIKLTSS